MTCFSPHRSITSVTSRPICSGFVLRIFRTSFKAAACNNPLFLIIPPSLPFSFPLPGQVWLDPAPDAMIRPTFQESSYTEENFSPLSLL